MCVRTRACVIMCVCVRVCVMPVPLWFYFVIPDDDCLIESLDGSNKYEPITSLDYLNMRIGATYWLSLGLTSLLELSNIVNLQLRSPVDNRKLTVF